MSFMFSRDTMLDHHLRYDHFPSQTVWFDTCREAIDAINGDPNGEHRVLGPDGYETIDAWNVIEAFHLDGFLTYEPEDIF